jgi:hypothetical protein
MLVAVGKVVTDTVAIPGSDPEAPLRTPVAIARVADMQRMGTEADLNAEVATSGCEEIWVAIQHSYNIYTEYQRTIADTDEGELRK